MPRVRQHDIDGAADRAVRRRTKSEAEKRLGARDIVLRLAWLDLPIVYWNGRAPPPPDAASRVFKPVRWVLVRLWSRRAPGLCAVRFAWARRNKRSGDGRANGLGLEVERVHEVTSERIAAAAHALKVAESYPKALPKLVGDFAPWLADRRARLESARGALAAVRALRTGAPEALAVEALCHWIGDDAGRPSETLATEAIQSWLGSVTDADRPGAWIAALVLGRRGAALSGPAALSVWHRAGRQFAGWPMDLASKVAPADALARAAALLRREHPHAHRSIAATAQEYALLARGPDWPGLASFFSGLCAWVERMRHEPERRRAQFGQLSRGTADRSGDADPAAAACGFPDSAHERAHLETAHDLPVWESALMGFAGRLAAACGSPIVVSDLLAWLEICRETIAPGPSGLDAFKLALSVAVGTSPAGDAPAELSAHFKVLATLGDRVLRQANERSEFLGPLSVESVDLVAETVDRAALFAHLPADQCAKLVELNRSSHLEELGRRYPGALAELAGWLARIGSTPLWDHADRWARMALHHDAGAVRALRSWAETHASGAGLNWGDLTAICDSLLNDVPSEETKADYIRFVTRRRGLLDRVLASAGEFWHRVQAAGMEQMDLAGICDSFEWRQPVLSAAFFWDRAGHPAPTRFADVLLAQCRAHEARALGGRRLPDAYGGIPYHAYVLELAVSLCGARPGRFLDLARALKNRVADVDQALAGWVALAPDRVVRQFLRECAGKPELLNRICRLLCRAMTAKRLAGRATLARCLHNWDAPRPPEGIPLPAGVPVEFRAVVDGIAAYRFLAGEPIPLPNAIVRALDEPAAMEREREQLRRIPAARESGTPEGRRLRKLDLILASDTSRAARLAGTLARVCPKQILLAKLSALERVFADAVARHWRSVFPGLEMRSDGRDADWDNALLLLASIRLNRRILRRMLREEAAGNGRWHIGHPPNRRFLEALEAAGVRDTGAWIDPEPAEYELHGARLTVHGEMNPLKVLRMGNYHGTCLAVGKTNAFAAVANAVEINKRVLFLRDAGGRILGRKLVALTRDGRLCGFCSYGGGHVFDIESIAGPCGPWTKILFDLYCLALARRVGLRLLTREEAHALEESDPTTGFALFARWYFDGFEEFDSWTLALSRGDPPPADPPASSRRSDPWASAAWIRWLIWSGDAALDPLARHVDILGDVERRFIARYTQSRVVRRFLNRSGAAPGD